MELEKAVQDAWRNEKCPIMNGILFASGNITLIAIRSLQLRGTWVELLDVIGTTTLDRLLQDAPDMLASITVLAQATAAEADLDIFCGEGSSGGDGFVAACRSAGGQLNWIAFFQESNPFRYIEIHGTDALVVNNCDQVWRFPLSLPQLCCVVK